jgi:L-iditol 2-dehydrogenase
VYLSIEPLENVGPEAAAGVGQDSEARLPAAEHVRLKIANLSEKPLEEHLRDSFGDHTPDLWVESSGSVKALCSALESVRPGGTVTVVGLYADEIQFSPTSAVRRELSLLFSYTTQTTRRPWTCWDAVI